MPADSKELKRLKELEAENRKLKTMYANLALDHQMAKEIIENLPAGRLHKKSQSLRLSPKPVLFFGCFGKCFLFKLEYIDIHVYWSIHRSCYNIIFKLFNLHCM